MLDTARVEQGRLRLVPNCRTGGAAAYHRVDGLSPGRWNLDVRYTTECEHMTIAFVIATNARGAKRYLAIGGLGAAGSVRVPFSYDLSADEHLGVAFGAVGSASGCGETALDRVVITRDRSP